MMSRIARNCSSKALGAVMALAAGLVALPAAAQGIDEVDPNAAIDGDLVPGAPAADSSTSGDAWGVDGTDNRYSGVTYADEAPQPTFENEWDNAPQADATGQAAIPPAQPADTSQTYAEDDLIGAAEGLFGKGAEGLAKVIQDILKDQGEPNGYIVGREGGGALVVGVRYGSGTLYHKIEGNMPVYWTGPSIGFDAGANAGNTFVLVYNLYDTEQLYERYPAGEGAAYLVGGFNASYMRKDNVVLIPIRVGAGLRLGVNAGYMRFSKKQRWLPF